MKQSVYLVFFSLVLVLTLFSNDTAVFTVMEADKQIVNQLQAGGYVLYMRHGKTDTSQQDAYPLDLTDSTKQRLLTDDGRKELQLISEAIKKAQIPYAHVYSSPMHRAKESAQIVFGEDIIIDNNLMYTSFLTSSEKEPIAERTLELISKPILEPGYNRVIVAHAPNLADVMGYFPEIEGTVIIFKPLGEAGYLYLGSITPDRWGHLLD